VAAFKKREYTGFGGKSIARKPQDEDFTVIALVIKTVNTG
jgi:hypothetical protein